jgi:hypothetical protein
MDPRFLQAMVSKEVRPGGWGAESPHFEEKLDRRNGDNIKFVLSELPFSLVYVHPSREWRRSRRYQASGASEEYCFRPAI